MNARDLTDLLEAVRDGRTAVDEAARSLAGLDDAALGFARLDRRRGLRTGAPEVVFGPGKSCSQLVEIAGSLLEAGPAVLVTRVDADQAGALRSAFPEAVHHETARAIEIDRRPERPAEGLVAVVAAGTADRPVAEEALVTAAWLGARTEAIHDVGVAGVHRLLAHADVLTRARTIVVVAGMDGALPSIVGGLFAAPIVAVPTSVGYGASFGGVAALLTMLNSCAAGVTVVNIDNGFGAGAAASRINRLGSPEAGQQAAIESPSHAASRARALERELTQLLGEAERLTREEVNEK